MKQALRGRAPLGASWWLLLMRLRTMGSTCSMSWAAAPQTSLDMQMQTRVAGGWQQSAHKHRSTQTVVIKDH